MPYSPAQSLGPRAPTFNVYIKLGLARSLSRKKKPAISPKKSAIPSTNRGFTSSQLPGSVMDTLGKIMWERPPSSDIHCPGPRSPYEERDAAGVYAVLRLPALRVTDFVSREALGNNLATSRELIAQSRKLIAESRLQIARIRSGCKLIRHEQVQ